LTHSASNAAAGQHKKVKLTTPMGSAFRTDLLNTTTRLPARELIGCLKTIIAQAQADGLVAQNVAASVAVNDKEREKGNIEVGIDIPS